MMKTFVCKLFDTDTFNVEGAENVNLNDNKQYNYTFWKLSKKLYRIPCEFKKEALDFFIFRSWFSMQTALSLEVHNQMVGRDA